MFYEKDFIYGAGSHDVVESTATASLSIENATVKFGTWVGILEYDVELVDNTPGHGSTTYPYTPDSCPAGNVDENGDGLCDLCGDTKHDHRGGSNY